MTDEEPPGEGRIVLTAEDGVATLTLDRPAKLNAIGPEMLAELARLLAQIDGDHDILAVIITGSGGRAFSVGADVNAWSALEPLDMWRRWIRDGHRVLERLAHLRSRCQKRRSAHCRDGPEQSDCRRRLVRPAPSR
jgi:enoyl-CoA hydratase/carnithine racemase